MSETCWAHKKWNKIASDIKLVFHSSTITMMHGPINIKVKTDRIIRTWAIVTFQQKLNQILSSALKHHVIWTITIKHLVKIKLQILVLFLPYISVILFYASVEEWFFFLFRVKYKQVFINYSYDRPKIKVTITLKLSLRVWNQPSISCMQISFNFNYSCVKLPVLFSLCSLKLTYKICTVAPNHSQKLQWNVSGMGGGDKDKETATIIWNVATA
jgi:hypothetical protein